MDIKTILKKRNYTKTPHILITGSVGSDKNYITKQLLMESIRSTDDNIILIDLYGDYKDIIKEIDNIQNINLFSLKDFINPLDIVEFDEYSFSLKVEFLNTFFTLLLNRELLAKEKHILFNIYKKVYENYKTPLLKDLLYELETSILKETNENEINTLILALKSINDYDDVFKMFQHPTTLENKRISYIALDNCPPVIKEVVYLFMIEYISIMMKKNISLKKQTTLFFPDILNLTNKYDIKDLSYYLSSFVKRARKYGCSIIFSEYSLKDTYAAYSHIYCNISSVILLKQSLEDKKLLKEIYNLTNEQIEFLINSNHIFWLDNGNILRI